MSESSFEKSLIYQKYLTYLNTFKYSIRSNVTNNDNDLNSKIDRKKFQCVLSNNKELCDYIKDESIDYDLTTYKSVILEKVKDVDYLRIQSFLGDSNMNKNELDLDRNENEQLGTLNKSSSNSYVFKLQTKNLFLENQEMIESAYNLKSIENSGSTPNEITLLVSINSLEAPNVKMMSKNLLNNILQQIVFTNNYSLYKSDVYKVFVPDDSVKCHQFMNAYQVDLDIGLDGLFIIGKLLKTMLNAKSLEKLRIICFYNDLKKFIPSVIEEFFVRLNEILLDISSSDSVEEVVEFINVFDNESNDVDFNEEDLSLIFSEKTKRQIFLNYKKFELLNNPESTFNHSSEKSKGKFLISNRIFLKFMDTFDWNIAFDKNIIQLVSDQLEFDVDSGHWITYLEDFFTEVLVHYFNRAIYSKNKFVMYSILKIDIQKQRSFESAKAISDDTLTDPSFQQFMETLVNKKDINSINECKDLLEHNDKLLEKIEKDFSKRIPRVSSFFKSLINDDLSGNTKINEYNFFKLYLDILDILATNNRGTIRKFLKNVCNINKPELIEQIIDKNLNFALNTSDVFLSYKMIDNVKILQTTNPNYRENLLKYDIQDLWPDNKENPYLFVAYKGFLELFNHIDKPIKLGDLFYCFKENIKEKLPSDDDQFVMALFVYTINQMTHAGLYEISNLHAVKSVFKGF